MSQWIAEYMRLFMIKESEMSMSSHTTTAPPNTTSQITTCTVPSQDATTFIKQSVSPSSTPIQSPKIRVESPEVLHASSFLPPNMPIPPLPLNTRLDQPIFIVERQNLTIEPQFNVTIKPRRVTECIKHTHTPLHNALPNVTTETQTEPPNFDIIRTVSNPHMEIPTPGREDRIPNKASVHSIVQSTVHSQVSSTTLIHTKSYSEMTFSKPKDEECYIAGMLKGYERGIRISDTNLDKMEEVKSSFDKYNGRKQSLVKSKSFKNVLSRTLSTKASTAAMSHPNIGRTRPEKTAQRKNDSISSEHSRDSSDFRESLSRMLGKKMEDTPVHETHETTSREVGVLPSFFNAELKQCLEEVVLDVVNRSLLTHDEPTHSAACLDYVHILNTANEIKEMLEDIRAKDLLSRKDVSNKDTQTEQPLGPDDPDVSCSDANLEDIIPHGHDDVTSPRYRCEILKNISVAQISRLHSNHNNLSTYHIVCMTVPGITVTPCWLYWKVSAITALSSVERDGRLAVGDVIFEIGNISVRGLNKVTVKKLLAEFCDGKILSITVMKSSSQPPTTKKRLLTNRNTAQFSSQSEFIKQDEMMYASLRKGMANRSV